FGNVDRGQQRPLLVAGWAGGHRRAAMVGCLQEKATNRAPCFACSVLAVGAANSGKPFLQIATLEKGCHRLLDDAAPVAILGLRASSLFSIGNREAHLRCGCTRRFR
ncbi:MAG: hypothetical protein O3C40_28075, partial [Planctomycetota bacterium]|nr:hypothetical protein [Planctomycetota bacterium]